MSLRLGYMVPEFPGQTHVFFWREIKALRRMGVHLKIVSTKKPSPLICQHDFARAALAETHYVYPPRLSHLLSWATSNVRSLSSAYHYINGLDESQTSFSRWGMLITAIDLLQWARNARIEHIHGHSCANSAHLLALVRMMGGPSYSLTLHGDLSVYGYDHAAKMSGAKFVCAVGNHLVEQIVDQVGIPKARLFSSFMGVRTDALTAVSDGRVYDREGLHLVTVARLHQSKGHFHALAAIHQAKKSGLVVHYTMAGEGYYRDAITSRIEELGLEAETTLMGTVSEADVFQLLSCADTFVLPSVGSGEAWPVSVMEAMSAGLPVIASIIGATPEMITDGIDGFLVPQGAEEALLELVTRLHNHHDLRRKIGAEARRTACRRFDVELTAKALVNAICEMD